MKKQLLAAGLVTLSLLALTAKDKDPVLMNIAGKMYLSASLNTFSIRTIHSR